MATTTATLLLTLDATSGAHGDRGTRPSSTVTVAGCERFFRLLDAHALAATWLVDENSQADLIGAIGSMRVPQDIVRRPRGAAQPRVGATLATRVFDAREADVQLDALFVGNAGRSGVAGEWVPSSFRLVSFRSALQRAIRDSSVCHVFFRLGELSRRPQSIRLLEDLLFRVAEERRLRRLRVVTLSEARRKFADARLIDAA